MSGGYAPRGKGGRISGVLLSRDRRRNCTRICAGFRHGGRSRDAGIIRACRLIPGDAAARGPSYLPCSGCRCRTERAGPMESDSKLRAVLDAVSALEALAFNAERIAEHDANCGRVDAEPPPGTLEEKIEWMKANGDGRERTRCELRGRLLSTGGDRTLAEAREWCERLAEAVVGFGRVDIAKAAPEIERAWMSFDHALRDSTPGMVLTLDAERIRRATDAAREAVKTMEAEAVAGNAAREPEKVYRSPAWIDTATDGELHAHKLRTQALRGNVERKEIAPRRYEFELHSVMRFWPDCRDEIEATLRAERRMQAERARK